MKIEINREYCIIPFRYDRAQFVSRGIWAEHSPSLDRDALYDFVDMGKQSMRIYGLDFNRCDRFSKFCQKKSVVALDGGDVYFRIVNDKANSWRTPRLVLSQSADVGFLWLPVEIAGNPTLAEVINFNYRFQKFDSGRGKTFVCNGSEWRLSDVISWMLAPLGDGVKMFEGYRAHIFTYLLVDGVQNLDDKGLRGDILNLVHGRNSRYSSLDDEFDEGTMLRTFKNIYMGSSVEGGCMIGLLKHDDSDGFMRSYHDTTFQSRFLWIYILAYMQRYVLLDIDSSIAGAAPTGNSMSPTEADDFRHRVAATCSARLSGFFSTISPYLHLDKIYSFLSSSFGLPALYRELDDKLRIFDTWLELASAERSSRFERFVKVGGVLLAVLSILYAVPQTISAVRQAYDESLWGWTIISAVPAVVAIIWIVWMHRKSNN